MAKLSGSIPPPEMIQAAKTVFMAMAYVETIRPIVEEYERKILAELKPLVRAEWRERLGSEPITDPDNAYEMEDSDFDAFFSRCKEEREKAGLLIKDDDFCPLLVAERLLTEAENALVDVMVPVTGIRCKDLYHIEDKKRLIYLTMTLLAPFCGSSDDILRNVGKSTSRQVNLRL